MIDSRPTVNLLCVYMGQAKQAEEEKEKKERERGRERWGGGEIIIMVQCNNNNNNRERVFEMELGIGVTTTAQWLPPLQHSGSHHYSTVAPTATVTDASFLSIARVRR